jgi:pimeloyl-ACP methyl ester carboxylesterase
MVVASRGVLPLARALQARGMAVHVPDLPGFGRSDKPPRALDVAGLAESLAAWVDASGLGGCTLLGNSFGTQVAAAAAAGSPAVAARLVLLAPTIDPRLRGAWASRLPAGHPGGGPRGAGSSAVRRAWRDLLVPPPSPAEQPTLGSLIRHEYLAAGPARALSTWRHALRDDIADRIPRIAVPLLVLRGGEDGLVSAGWARRLAEAAPDGRYGEIPGIDHDGQFNAPDPVAEQVSAFLAAPTTREPRFVPEAPG